MSEINTTGLPKATTKPLEKIEAYIDWFKSGKGYPPESVHLRADDFSKLEKALLENGQSLRHCTYKGVKLLSAGS